MSSESKTIDLMETVSKKREAKRLFFRQSTGFGIGIIGGGILAACGGNDDGVAVAQTTPPVAGPTDAEILNFALNLEYLEAQFYQYAATGSGLAANLLTGTGTQGAVIPGKAVTFTDPVVAAYAREIAQDEVAHVAFLRTALGASAVAQPAIDVGFSNPNGAFSVAARAAGLVGPNVVFDPYASDENFLLAAYIFEDVGVTAYKGASPLISSKTFLEAAAGILAVEAYHAGLIRTVLYAKGLATPSLRSATVAISDARDSLDNSIDDDQGVIGSNPLISNIVPTDANGLAYSRSYQDVLNIVFLSRDAVTQGGFFPAGVNGTLRMSSAFI